ncbi:MAG: hypothetical protein ACRC5A_05635 [Enterobacteriaceae bacterium]
MRKKTISLIFITLIATITLPLKAAGLSTDEQKMVDYINGHMGEATALVQQLAEINSGTMNFPGVRKVADSLAPALSQLGFATQWINHM